MNIKYLTYLLPATMALASCGDYLDVKPMGKLIPSEVADFDHLLNNEQTLQGYFEDNNRESMLAFLGDNVTISENEATYLYTNTHPNVERWAAFKFQAPYQDPNLPQYTWENGIYRAAGLLNNVINGIDDLGMANEAEGQVVIAQARAARGWGYMIAGLGYGPMYNPSGQNSTRTIPYRVSESATEANPDLAPTEELMELAKADIDYAIQYCPTSVATPARANQAAAYAIRALWNMYERRWEDMYSDADRALTLSLDANWGDPSGLLYDFNTFSYVDNGATDVQEGYSPEVSQMLQGDDNGFRYSYSKENLFYRECPRGTIYPSDEYLAIFDAETDQRYRLFMLRYAGYSTTQGDDVLTDGVRLYNYRERKTMGNVGVTFPELYLMRAEAAARLGRLSEALADLNTLRQYRYTAEASLLAGGSTMSQDELLTEILNERRRELPMASFQRVLDLKRYVYDAGKPWAKTSITHTVGQHVYTAPIDDAHFTLQISNSIIRYNPHWGLTENNDLYSPAGF